MPAGGRVAGPPLRRTRISRYGIFQRDGAATARGAFAGSGRAESGGRPDDGAHRERADGPVDADGVARLLGKLSGDAGDSGGHENVCAWREREVLPGAGRRSGGGWRDPCVAPGRGWIVWREHAASISQSRSADGASEGEA